MQIRRSAAMFGAVAVVGALAAVWVPGNAKAALLYYNGDYDLNDGAVNQTNVPINTGSGYQLETALVYDDFTVPVGQTWTITSLFSDDQIAYSTAATKATWQIRSGMLPGQGGTLLYSGDSTATQALQHAANGLTYIDPEYRVSETVSGITLTAGTYWMAIAPDSAGYYGDQSYIETTSGSNSVGLVSGINGSSYITNNLTGPGKVTYGLSTLDYSAGIQGTVTIVPEPGTAAAFVFGTGLLGRRRKRMISL